eukprot:scaffold236967_cov24-Tisochrysis_lutea.AAC.1
MAAGEVVPARSRARAPMDLSSSVPKQQYIRACRREGKGWAGGVPEEGTHGLHSSATKQQVQP